MPSEIEIRSAIVGQMTTALAAFTPAPLILDRDITGILESGAYSGLLDSGDPAKIHCWVVTQRSMLPVDIRQGGTLYELVYDLTQIYQYRSGSDLSNSVRDASLERDAVINAFKYASALPTILMRAHVKPVEWPEGLIDRPEPITRGTARQSRAILRANNFYGPIGCS